MHTHIATLILAASLAGCATGSGPHWYNASVTNEQAQKDFAECKYEALKAVQQTDPNMRSIFGQELDLANRRNEVIAACMQVRGYRNQ